MPATTRSAEQDLLDTGGGVANALPLLGKDPFLVVNADIVWLDGPIPVLERLAAAWCDESMDALLMMNRTVSAHGYAGSGDYFIDPHGVMRRRDAHNVSPYVFAGVQMLHPRLFAEAPPCPFSLNVLFDKAEIDKRLFGIVHDGEWFHVGTPDALKTADDRLFGRPGAHDFHVG